MNVHERPPHDAQTPLWIIASGVIIVALYAGRLFLVPIAFAALISVVCRPMVRWLHRSLHVPPPVSAGLVVLTLLAVLAGASVLLAGPVHRWWDSAPDNFAAAEKRLAGFGEPLRQLTALESRLDHLGSSPANSSTTREATTAPADALPANAAAPGAGATGLAIGFFGGVTELLGGIAEVFFLVFLILSADGLFLRKLCETISTDKGKQDATSVVHEAESLVLRFLLVALAINIGQATVVGITLKLLGIQHALLWAALTVVLEFVPYLGATVMVVLLSVTALATFDSVGHAALVPGSYLAISTLQNSIVSPLLYGKRLKLNAVAILIGVIFFFFVWGVPGAFVAVPILAIVRISAEKSDRWKPLSQYLAD